MFHSVTLEVIGDQRLHCEACEHRVTQLLTRVQGVSQVRAHAETQRIDVLFNATVLEPGAIAHRLSAAGYETRVASS